MSVEEIEIGMSVMDTRTGVVNVIDDEGHIKKVKYGKREVRITNKTSNSVEVFVEAKTKIGIDCKQWFTFKDFNERFRVMKLEDIKIKK